MAEAPNSCYKGPMDPVWSHQGSRPGLVQLQAMRDGTLSSHLYADAGVIPHTLDASDVILEEGTEEDMGSGTLHC